MMQPLSYLQLLSRQASNYVRKKLSVRLISEASYNATSTLPSFFVGQGKQVSKKEFARGLLASPDQFSRAVNAKGGVSFWLGPLAPLTSMP